MRIDRLDLTAFGPFTDVSLDLSGGSMGLHVVFGPNEAGKSSALRAIKQFFCGIPHQSSDNFVHKYDKMRVGVSLRGRDGVSTVLARRKGKDKTLLGPDGLAVDDGPLAGALGGTSPEDYVRRFVIDHGELVAGGRDLVAGRGDLGRALFAAGGGGLARVGSVQKELKEQAEQLFLPRGSKPSINADLAELERFRREVREASLPSVDWVRHDEALREARSRRGAIEADREAAERERNRLTRLAEAVGPLAARREALEELAGLADAPRLAGNFGFRLADARSRLPSTERAWEEAKRRLKELTADRDLLDVPEALLEQAGAIEGLYRRLGGVGQALAERRRLDAEFHRLAGAVRDALRDLGRDPSLADPALAGDADGALSALRQSAADRDRIAELGMRIRAAPLARDAAAKALSEHDARRSAAARALEAAGPGRDPGPLKKALKEARQAGDLDAANRRDREALGADRANALAGLAALGYWSGPLDAVEALAVPPVEAVEGANAAFEALDREEADLLRQDREAEAAGREIESGLERLRLEGDVPTEEALGEARALRDRAWRRLRSSWDDPTADAFEEATRAADNAADRLRREADRVAARARLLADRGRLAAVRDDLRARRGAAAGRRAVAEGDWSALWAAAGLDRPGPPVLMWGWLRKQADLADAARKVREAGARLESSEARAASIVGALAKALADLGAPPGGPDESLADRADRAQEVLDRLAVGATDRVRLLGVLADLDARRPDLERDALAAAEAHDDWRRQWAEALAGLRLPADVSPPAATARLSRTAELFERLEQARACRRQSEALADEAARFAADVRALAGRVAPDLLGPVAPTGAWPSHPWGLDEPGLGRSGGSPALLFPETEASDEESPAPSLSPAEAEALAVALHRRLADARAARQKFEHLSASIDEKKEEARNARAEVESLRGALAGLRREARCGGDEGGVGGGPGDDDGLDRAVARDGRRRELEAERDRLDETLRRLAANTPLSDFIEEVGKADPDAIPPRIDRLSARIEELRREAEGVNQAIGRETAELARWKGGSDAAEVEQAYESLRAKLRADAEQYGRLRLAQAVLRAGVERYRKKAQGPVLDRASAHFGRLTLGSFDGLRIDYDDRDEPALRATRPGGGAVGIDALSLGTADQLYLALRLATLDAFLDRHEPLPLIVDDVLIQFDDDRASATLEILGEFSARTQVILFTHHAHLVDLARARLAPGALFPHALPGRGA